MRRRVGSESALKESIRLARFNIVLFAAVCIVAFLRKYAIIGWRECQLQVFDLRQVLETVEK